jgi:nucleotide-binding universal stress UspA family protein
MLPLHIILCPTDFSDASREAVSQAVSLAARFNAELMLLHVIQPLPVSSRFSPYAQVIASHVPAYEDAAKANAQQTLETLINSLDCKHVRITGEVHQGYPADVIASTATQSKADLVVIATHGMTGWRRHIFGSVTENVLRLANTPILLIPAEQPEAEPLLPLQTIVCPTDFSEPSYAAMEVAGEWSRAFGAEVCFIHAIPALYSSHASPQEMKLAEMVEADAAQRLRHVIKEHLPENITTRALITQGSAAAQITSTAAEEKAGLIVIATHGAGAGHCQACGVAVDHFLFGSTSTNVLRSASCPVLTIKVASSETEK